MNARMEPALPRYHVRSWSDVGRDRRTALAEQIQNENASQLVRSVYSWSLAPEGGSALPWASTNKVDRLNTIDFCFTASPIL